MLAALQDADVLARELELLVRQPRAHGELAAALGELDAARAAQHQLGVDLGLEFADRLGHGRLAQVQAARGGADAAGVGQPQPGLELVVLHAAHSAARRHRVIPRQTQVVIATSDCLFRRAADF
ncbi:hypothetical protein D9M69_565610 [compost metagenome]